MILQARKISQMHSFLWGHLEKSKDRLWSQTDREACGGACWAATALSPRSSPALQVWCRHRMAAVRLRHSCAGLFGGGAVSSSSAPAPAEAPPSRATWFPLCCGVHGFCCYCCLFHVSPPTSFSRLKAFRIFSAAEPWPLSGHQTPSRLWDSATLEASQGVPTCGGPRGGPRNPRLGKVLWTGGEVQWGYFSFLQTGRISLPSKSECSQIFEYTEEFWCPILGIPKFLLLVFPFTVSSVSQFPPNQL